MRYMKVKGNTATNYIVAAQLFDSIIADVAACQTRPGGTGSQPRPVRSDTVRQLQLGPPGKHPHGAENGENMQVRTKDTAVPSQILMLL